MEDEGASPDLEKPTTVNQTMSPTIGKLALALSKAQGLMTGASATATSQVGGKTSAARKYKYATLADVWDSIREPLAKNELAVVQTTNPVSFSQVSVVTLLLHSSGEWIRGEIVLKNVAADPRGYGSALTYARRYGISAMVGGVSLDDDAEHAAAPKKSTTSGAPPAKSGGKKAKLEGDKPPSKAQLTSLEKSMGKELYLMFVSTNPSPSYETCRQKMIELAGGPKADPPPTKDDGPKEEKPKDDGAKTEPPKKGAKKELF